MTNEMPDHGEDMDMSEDMQETTEIPASLVGGEVKPGDTISLSVISVDSQNGMVTVSKSGGEQTAPEGGSDQMASEFDQEPS